MKEDLIEPLLESDPSAGKNPPTLELKKRGGAGRGQGRKKSARTLKKITANIYADQTPITDAEIREAIDVYLSSRRV